MEYTPLKFSSVYDDEIIDWGKVEEYHNEMFPEEEEQPYNKTCKSETKEVVNSGN